MVSTVIDLFFDEHLSVIFVASARSLYMRWKIRAVLVLIGIAAAAVGAQMYPLCDPRCDDNRGGVDNAVVYNGRDCGRADGWWNSAFGESYPPEF